MDELRALLHQAAGPDPAPVSVALIRSHAQQRHRRRRRLAAALAAAAVLLATLVVPRLAARPPAPAQILPEPLVTPGPLHPGRYTSQVAGVPVTFSIPAGENWTATRVNPDDLLLTDPDLTLEVDVTQWTRVNTYNPEGISLRTTQPVPVNLLGWLQARPGLTLGPTTTTQLAGQPAHQIQLELSDSYQPYTQPAQAARQSCGQPADCTTLATAAGRPLVLFRHSIMIIIVTDTPGSQRLIATALIPTNTPIDATQASQTAQRMLATFAASPRS